MIANSSRPSADLVPALVHPEPTGDKRIRQARERARPIPTEQPQDVTLPPLDVAALRKKYGDGNPHRPRVQRATFRAPLGATWDQYRSIRDVAVARWLKAMELKGLVLATRVQIGEGLYPAFDVAAQAHLLDQREFVVQAAFTRARVTSRRIALDPRLLEPLVVKGGSG